MSNTQLIWPRQRIHIHTKKMICWKKILHIFCALNHWFYEVFRVLKTQRYFFQAFLKNRYVHKLYICNIIKRATLLSDMFRFLRNLFRKNGTVSKTLDMIDKGKFTDQEKADLQLSLFKQKLNLSSETRRFLAKAVTLPYVFMVVIAFVVRFFDKDCGSDLITDLQKTDLGMAFIAIISFYFAIEGIKKIKGSKWHFLQDS